MKQVFTLLLSCVITILIAQGPPPTITIQGQVLESISNGPLEFATVVIIDQEGNPRKGTTTDAEGKFELKARSPKVSIEVSFIGFVAQTISDLQVSGGVADVGTVILMENNQSLDEVVVRAERSTTEFKLDKRVFNVGQDLSTTGSSALELLNSVPSVNVNIEGEITLRGSSGVQVLIDGKPSVTSDNTLGTITADMIEKIEVITNPSAKYDAEGTSGILNIVLKKDEKKGINGSVSVNTGIPHSHSVGLSLNNRTKKFNLFTQLGVGYKVVPTYTKNINRNYLNSTYTETNGDEFRNEFFYNMVLGSDYYIDENNVITLSGRFAYEVEDQPSNTNVIIIDSLDNSTTEWERTEETSALNPKFRYELQYKRDFTDHKEHDLLFSALGQLFSKDQESVFMNSIIRGENPLTNQETETDFRESKYTFKLDYTKPINELWSVETGAQYVINDVGNEYAVRDLIDGVWVENPNFTNDFQYDQNVLAGYATIAYENKVWGAKAGLRAENTDLETYLATTDQRNSQLFTNFFPSFHTSYKVSDRFSLQAGYSKRIYRPRLWDLNPFFNIRNNFSIRTGNPDLLPEYTDSYEITGIYILDKLSLNGSIYYRYTTDQIERISVFEDNVNILKPFNLGTSKRTGFEANGKYQMSKKITFNGDFNYNIFRREGMYNDANFDFTADQWSGKLTSKLKLQPSLDLELIGRHESRQQTVQGEVLPITFMDIGLRKKFNKGKTVLSLSVLDVFATKITERTSEGPTFDTYQRRFRGRFVRLGFSYGFGKGEAMQYGGGGRRR